MISWFTLCYYFVEKGDTHLFLQTAYIKQSAMNNRFTLDADSCNSNCNIIMISCNISVKLKGWILYDISESKINIHHTNYVFIANLKFKK